MEIGWLLTALGGAGTLLVGHTWLRAISSKQWSETDAVVERKNIQEERASVRVYNFYIEYRFQVGMREYTGNQLKFGSRTFDKCRIQDLERKYPVGATIRIFYNPHNPRISVIEPGPTSDLIAVLAIAFIACVLGILLLVFD